MLLAAYSDRVYNTALGLLQQAEAAEDIAQEVFLAVYQGIGKFRGEAKLSTWIYRIAVTKSLEALRKGKRRRQATADDGFNLLGDVPDTGFHHPGVLMENRERATVLFAAIDRLPEQQKLAFVLHHTEGLSYAEIAGVLENSLPAIESLIYRAKQNLQKMLASFYRHHK